MLFKRIKDWEIKKIVFQHPDVIKHGFLMSIGFLTEKIFYWLVELPTMTPSKGHIITMMPTTSHFFASKNLGNKLMGRFIMLQ
jgi:hypothetical protein